MNIENKRVLVVGLGGSGISALKLLASKGATLHATDSRSEEELASVLQELADYDIKFHLGEHPLGLFTGADIIVLSPGVPRAIAPVQAALEAGVKVISEVELACNYLNIPIIAITGSNGKSTTTAMTAHLLRQSGLSAAECGNIGKPVSDFALNYDGNEILVAELSSFQLESMETFQPQIATVLNVTPDHMDRYPDFESYKKSKYEIFARQSLENYVLINADEKHCSEIAGSTVSRKLFFGEFRPGLPGVFEKDGSIVWVKDGEETYLMESDEISLPGPHNLSNSLAAAAMALNAGGNQDGVVEGLRSFQSLEHRLEPVATINGIRFINDSKATNVDSTAAALQSFNTPINVIMGGKDKDGDFAALEPIMLEHVKYLLLIGDAAEKINASISEFVSKTICSSLAEAVKLAYDLAEENGIVLLAPGCASFDMFDNFEHRGKEFKKIVRSMVDG